MNIFSYYLSAINLKTKPILLEFTHPIKKTPLSICGINPKIVLEVRNNTLYKNGVAIGSALDIFEHLHVESDEKFFPAFLGFFSYEFARYLNKPCKKSHDIFPDAYFCFYDEGLVIDDETIVHHTPLDEIIFEHLNLSLKGDALSPSMTSDTFFSVVKEIKERIKHGDVYQVNYSLPFYFDANDDDMLAIYHGMRINNKSPFMGAISSPDFWLLSGSPERLFSLHNNLITARPIAGTKKRGASDIEDQQQQEMLVACKKENAEHAMLVDLMRNDLNQIAVPCTVEVVEDRSVEFYSHVMHLVSEVSATTNASLLEIFRALFPGGTITGAPKENVMGTIAELECGPRGAYTGSLGYISAGFGVDFNILIRSVYQANDRAWINTGAGIVIDSDENNEWKEIHRKAMAINDILLKRISPREKRQTVRGAQLVAKKPEPLSFTRNVLFIENHDSFSFNIVDALRALSARVDVTSTSSLTLENYSHVVIGPGPGNPTALPELLALLQTALAMNLPILGICLGHQAIGYFFGAKIRKLLQPVHGKSHAVFHNGDGLFNGLSSPTNFARYHSLVVSRAPADFVVDAYTEDDSIMAIRHKTLPIFGVQFHPESYLSQSGHVILKNFLMESRRG